MIEGVENATVIGEFAFGVSEVAPFGTPSEKGRVGTVHSRSATTTTPIRAARTSARCTSTASMLEASMQIVDNGRWILQGRRSGCCEARKEDA